MADVEAEVNCQTLVSELEPCFSDSTPAKSVSDCNAEESELRSLPMLLRTVSCDCNAESWFFHGVSTACMFVTIWLTVEVTSKPCPLVGDPNERPTVPMPVVSALSGKT